MPYHPAPSRAPFNLAAEHARWLFDDAGRAFPIVARSRRTVTVACGTRLVTLKRRRLEAAGYDLASDGTAYLVTCYPLKEIA